MRLIARTTRASLLCAAATVLAACSDVSTGPKDQALDHSSGPNFLLGLGGSGRSDTTITRFTVKPGASGTYWIGGVHKISIPAYAICSLKSSYGPTEWNKACTPESNSVVITAKSWKDRAGHPYIDFSPALRFSPDKTVTLYMKEGLLNKLLSYRIDYCPIGLSSGCVNESLLDSTLKTLLDLLNSYVYRRIKHFSGYHVAAG
jgi:hypothetical protein